MIKDGEVQHEFYQLFMDEVDSFNSKAKSHVVELKNHFNTQVLPILNKEVLREACKPSARNFERKLVAVYGLYRTRELLTKELAKHISYEHDGKPLRSYFEIESTAVQGCRYLEDSLREAGHKIINNVIIFDCLIGQISQICSLFFFGFEAITKLFLLSFCLKLSTRVIQGQVIQHSDMWRTLRMLGAHKNQTDCQICRLKDDCSFRYPFDSLAGLYAFIIKIRMLTDYTEVMHNDMRFFNFISTKYPKLMFPLFISLDTQISRIHKGFLHGPLSLKDDFRHVDDILSNK